METDQGTMPARPVRSPAVLISSPVSVIFDSEIIRTRLSEAIVGCQGSQECRKAAVEVLLEAQSEARAEICAEIRRRPHDAHLAIYDYARLADQIVIAVLDFASGTLHPRGAPTASEHIAALAVGGYGRGQMAPFSDVDLLFLKPYKQTAWGESLIESVLYCLWDLKLKVGHAVRTVDECLRLAQSDITISTTLLEKRLIWGDESLAESLDTRLWTEQFDNGGTEFVELKLEERDRRHERQGGSRYLLEPNVKESKGSLRDLQTLFWIGKYLNHVDTAEGLVDLGVFTFDEYEVFVRAAEFLWTARVHLHLLTNRASEKLTFDMQVELADALNYQPTAGQSAVECFMQDYFTHAKNVGDLTRIFLAALEARHVKSRPSIAHALRSVFSFGRDGKGPKYRLKHGRMEIVDEERFLSDPVNFLRLFRERLSTGVPVHPDALRVVARNLDLIDDRMRADPEANRIFLELLLSHSNPERELRLMNEVGVLGAFLPEFGRIVAMMQFNMYHHYTVDEHTIQAISNLSQIERGKLIQEVPVSSHILSKGINRRVLYVAMLLHDAGKGSDRDHSEYGAELAEQACTRLGLNESETELVVWLVRNHLVMSDTAQRRDLTDPRTVRDFARFVKSPTRLNLLIVLTVCDIRAVGPNTWNNWKATLLRSLHGGSLEYLSGGSQSEARPEREQAAREILSEALEGWSEENIRRETERHYSAYWLGFDKRTHVIFANLLRDLPESETGINITRDEERDATQICITLADHPGMFTRLTGALALAGANIVDARSYISSDGMTTAAFWVQDHAGKPYASSRLSRLRNSVRRTLGGEIVAAEALREKDRIKPRERKFVVPTRISFDNSGSDIYTIIEIETRDRPGLLFEVSKALASQSISIASAIVATYGKQAVDVFYVKDIFGLKLHSINKQNALERRLRAAIEIASDPVD